MEVKVRFAPSPTGFLHVGGLRTALFNYLYAKKIGGKIILRIEDTDQTRKVENAVEYLLSTFESLNIQFDEGPNIGGCNGPYYQSLRLSFYEDHINILLKNESVYPCFCTSARLDKLRKKLTAKKKTIKYDRYCLRLSKDEVQSQMNTKQHVIRMRVPDNGEVVFYDTIRGKVSIKCSELDDQVLIKSDGYPTYHFANVVDDHFMGITHVMRGEEWLSSTPKHILLYQFFDWKLPKFIHLPLLLNSDKSKLSKRQGDVAVENYLQKGYLPEAILNFVALLGWHPKNEQEIFSLPELEKEFSLKRIHKSGAVFDIEKLNWMNGQYLKNMPVDILINYAKPEFESAGLNVSDTRKFKAVIKNARKRSNTVLEMIEHSVPFFNKLTFSNDELNSLKNDSSQLVLKYFSEKLSNQIIWSEEEIKSLVKEAGESTNVSGKELYYPLRLSLFGASQGPDIHCLVDVLGVDESIKRIKSHL